MMIGRPSLLVSVFTTTALAYNPLHRSPTTSRAALLDRRSSLALVTAALFVPLPAAALVKGVAPPPTKKVSDRPKCTNVEECQELAERKADLERAAAEADAVPSLTTAGGTRYRDIIIGSGPEVKPGDEVKVYYKVLKLGKRSYDGLSGEGTVVFSRGYGLEDDEAAPGLKGFITTVGGLSNIVALNQALLGMKVGGMRRFAILPQQGWRKPTAMCDGGPGGLGGMYLNIIAT